MATTERLAVIDADAHVVESERTWDYLEPAEEKYRPVLVSSPNDPSLEYWIVEHKIRGFRFKSFDEEAAAALSAKAGKHMEGQRDRREMADVQLRLRHLDELGIDIQVLFHTMWIERVADTPDVEAALCRSWNRWLADIWRQGEGRLRWCCVVPTMNLSEATAQMKYAKEHGAVAVGIRPIEGDRLISDPYFYPLYEAAERLDLAVAIHIANGNAAMSELFTSPVDPVSSNGFAKFRAPTVTACHTLLMSQLPHLFPKVRWAFIEASAQWVPWVVREARVRHDALGTELPADPFRAWNIFVSAQTDDDIPYLLTQGLGDNLLIGTDYGHFDPSSDVDAISVFKETTPIGQDGIDNILHHNPKRLYGLEVD